MSVDQGMNPYTGQPVGEPVSQTDNAEVDRVCRAAAAAAPILAALPLPERAGLLRVVADALESARAEIVALADAETGLGVARLGTELTRTRIQLEMFADVVSDGSFLDVMIDPPDPFGVLGPRPDLRRMLVPLGPVAVFAASNFPLAFSVAGGDTASALAAGCPVVVKAHPGHPALSQLCGRLIQQALVAAGAPEGTFAIVHGLAAGQTLVTHPAITAVGFTGSLSGGRALFDLVNRRPDPIPFYGELGSLNPTVVTPGALAARADDIVTGFVGSLTVGAGQFCTKPGLLFLPAGHGLDNALAKAVAAATVGPLLNARLRDEFLRTAAELTAAPGVRTVTATGAGTGPGYHATPLLLAVGVTDLLANPDNLLRECFGPAALIVEYDELGELRQALDVLPGSLTATVHADPGTEPELSRELFARLSARAGRLIWNGWPTGVAVTAAMQHGGPWPATTAPLHTSVGETAIRRFLRPVVYQNVPEMLLPDVLRDSNPAGVPRQVKPSETARPR